MWFKLYVILNLNIGGFGVVQINIRTGLEFTEFFFLCSNQ